MSVYLPLAMQQLFNTPMAMHDSTAEMVIAAVSGRMNIQALISDSQTLDARALQDLAMMGRHEARIEIEAAKKKPASSKMGSKGARDEGDSFLRVGNKAVIPVKGVLKSEWGVGPYSGATGYDGIQTMHVDALNDPSINGIWYDITSGGGAVAKLFGLTDLIHATNAKAGGKPVYAFAGDNAYSAAYAIGAAADKFYMPETGGVGSIGIITMLADPAKALAQEGIDVTVVRYPAKKALGSGPGEIDEAVINHTMAAVKFTAEHFQDRVAQYRGISKKSVVATEGLDYMASEALAIGLVNGVMSELAAWAQFDRKVS